MANRVLDYGFEALLKGSVNINNVGRLALVSNDWSSGSFDSAIRTYNSVVSGVSYVYGANATYTSDRVGIGRLFKTSTNIPVTTGGVVDGLLVCLGAVSGGTGASVGFIYYDTHSSLPWATTTGTATIAWASNLVWEIT